MSRHRMPAPASGLQRPGTLLLDFGGVIVESAGRPEGVSEVAEEVEALLQARGLTDLPAPRIAADIRAGIASWDDWKRARSRERAPRDISHQEFWARFVGGTWDEPARRVAMDAAFELCRSLSRRSSVRRLRPGIERLTRVIHESGIPIAVVSNALSGTVHREMLEELGLTTRIAHQAYSDEVGIRKPNPAIILDAVCRLGGDPREAWYVGDQHDRDVLCGRRAGIGTVVLLATDRHPQPLRRRSMPDLEVDTADALADIVTAVLERSAVGSRVVA